MRSPLRRLRRLAAPVVDLETLWLLEATTTSSPAAGNDVLTRPAAAADRPAVAALVGQRTVRDGTRRNDACLVADDGGVVGCAWLSTAPHRIAKYNLRVRPRAAEGYVYGVFVRSDAREKGTAHALLAALSERAARDGISTLLAHISPRNPITPHLFVDVLGYRLRERLHVVVLLQRVGFPLPRHRGRRASARIRSAGEEPQSFGDTLSDRRYLRP